jgi:predicted type IV restriction endonuclease
MASAVQAAGWTSHRLFSEPRIRNMSSRQNEAFSRILIDKALEFSGWDLLNPRQVQFELHGTTGVQIIY